jgi:hypothetical protein
MFRQEHCHYDDENLEEIKFYYRTIWMLLYGPCLIYSTGSPSAFDLGASSCCACLLHDDYAKETIHHENNEFANALYDW